MTYLLIDMWRVSIVVGIKSSRGLRFTRGRKCTRAERFGHTIWGHSSQSTATLVLSWVVSGVRLEYRCVRVWHCGDVSTVRRTVTGWSVFWWRIQSDVTIGTTHVAIFAFDSSAPWRANFAISWTTLRRQTIWYHWQSGGRRRRVLRMCGAISRRWWRVEGGACGLDLGLLGRAARPKEIHQRLHRHDPAMGGTSPGNQRQNYKKGWQNGM